MPSITPFDLVFCQHHLIYFLMLVNKGERFGKGDVLDVDMRIVQMGLGMKTSIERSIIKVHKHLTPQEQSTLL